MPCGWGTAPSLGFSLPDQASPSPEDGGLSTGSQGWGPVWVGHGELEEKGASPRDPTLMPLRKKELKAYVKRFANRHLDDLSVKESGPYGLNVPDFTYGFKN